MRHRSLALVAVLAGGDYLLWNWSLNGSHDVLALISGLALTPLALALLWLLALNVARLLGHVAQRPPAHGLVASPRRSAPALAIDDERSGEERSASKYDVPKRERADEQAASSKLAA